MVGWLVGSLNLSEMVVVWYRKNVKQIFSLFAFKCEIKPQNNIETRKYLHSL